MSSDTFTVGVITGAILYFVVGQAVDNFILPSITVDGSRLDDVAKGELSPAVLYHEFTTAVEPTLYQLGKPLEISVTTPDETMTIYYDPEDGVNRLMRHEGNMVQLAPSGP